MNMRVLRRKRTGEAMGFYTVTDGGGWHLRCRPAVILRLTLQSALDIRREISVFGSRRPVILLFASLTD